MAEIYDTAEVRFVAGEGGRLHGRFHPEGGFLVVGDTNVNNWLLAMLGGSFNFQGLIEVKVYHSFPNITTAVGDLGQMEASEPKGDSGKGKGAA